MNATNPALVDTFETLLKRAEEAHKAHQQLHGEDDNWPPFYAEHMLRTLGEESYSYDQLLTALRNAATAHGVHEAETGEPDAEWARWYAQRMVTELSRGNRAFWAALDDTNDD